MTLVVKQIISRDISFGKVAKLYAERKRNSYFQTRVKDFSLQNFEKELQCEADHSPSFSTKAENVQS
jgi:hypothetical protein